MMTVHTRGFTLLEVLIAVLILAIGLLGLAKLQVLGLHANQSANLRTEATLLAYDIADRMRANRAAYRDASGHYIDLPGGTTSKQCAYNGSVQDCTSTEMAQFDLAAWRAQVTSALPGGVATVCRDTSPNDGGDDNGDGAVDASEYSCSNSGSVYAIKIWWLDKDSPPAFTRFVTTFQP